MDRRQKCIESSTAPIERGDSFDCCTEKYEILFNILASKIWKLSIYISMTFKTNKRNNCLCTLHLTLLMVISAYAGNETVYEEILQEILRPRRSV